MSLPNAEIVQEILAEYRRLKSPFKVATALGLEVGVVWNVIDQNEDQLQPYAERNGGYGRPELAPFMVARRNVNSRTTWDNEDPAIAQARADYEAGTHEMTTGRDGAWLILYSIPRRKRDPRPDYFTPTF